MGELLEKVKVFLQDIYYWVVQLFKKLGVEVPDEDVTKPSF